MKFRTLAITILTLAIMVGCGHHHETPPPTTGGGGGTPPPAKVVATISHSSNPGMHIHDVRKTTASSISVIWDGMFPTAYAQQVVTVQVSQNWEGVCNNSPLPGTGQEFVSYLVFGIGQNTKAACSDSFFDTDGTVAAQNALDGKLVLGAGTISNLVVSTDRGTNIVSGGIPVKVWVKRDNTVQFTGITCTVPSGTNELICQGTQTFAAQNLDRVIVTATKSDGDIIIGLSVNFTKSIP